MTEACVEYRSGKEATKEEFWPPEKVNRTYRIARIRIGLDMETFGHPLKYTRKGIRKSRGKATLYLRTDNSVTLRWICSIHGALGNGSIVYYEKEDDCLHLRSLKNSVNMDEYASLCGSVVFSISGLSSQENEVTGEKIIDACPGESLKIMGRAGSKRKGEDLCL
jgi:hypothetical protein